MEAYSGNFLGQKITDEAVALTVGNFDGLHLGHQYLVNHLKDIAKEKSLKTAVLSFSPHPHNVLGREKLSLLSTQEQRNSIIGDLGVDYWVVQDFLPQFYQLSAEDFLRQYLCQCFDLRYLLLGYDFRFGQGGVGDFSLAQDFGNQNNFTVEQLDCFREGGSLASSTAIRETLGQGDVEQAHRLLGRPYSVKGVVVSGDQIGRDLGFPTANLSEIETLVPQNGVYAGYVVCGGVRKKAVLNIGLRPTVSEGLEKRVECHVLDFSGDLYGKSLEFNFLYKIRDEKKFSGKIELKEQISEDLKSAQQLLARSTLV